MRASDIFSALFGALHSEPKPAIGADFPRPTTEQVLSPWSLETPPLRYEVDSLEHWLDLNA
jgi:hypothetical protein